MFLGLRQGGDGGGAAAGAGFVPLLRREGACGGRRHPVAVLLYPSLLPIQAQVLVLALLQASGFVRFVVVDFIPIQ